MVHERGIGAEEMQPMRFEIQLHSARSLPVSKIAEIQRSSSLQLPEAILGIPDCLVARVWTSRISRIVSSVSTRSAGRPLMRKQTQSSKPSYNVSRDWAL